MRRLAVLAFFTPTLGRAATAPPARLIYEVGPGTEACPSARELASDVSAKLGYDPFREDAARRVIVRLSSEPQGLRAQIQLFDERNQNQGERELTSQEQDCRELASAVAFAVSVALDPMAAPRPPPAASSATPVASVPPPIASAPVPTASALPVAPSLPPASPPSLLEAHAGLGAQVAFAVAPAAAPGVTAQIGLDWPSFSLSLEGRMDLAAGRPVGEGRVESALLLGSLIPCRRLFSSLSGCAVLSAGGLRGSGSGVDEPRTATTFFAALGPRLAGQPFARGPLSPLRLWADLLVPLTRTRLAIDGKEAWRTPSVSAIVGLGLSFRFL